MKLSSVVIVAMLLSTKCYAQSIFTNPITGSDPSAANPYTAGQTVNVNITVSGIGRGSGVAPASAGNRYTADGWDTAQLDTSGYFNWILTPNSTSKISFSSFTYTGQASGNGPSNFAFRSSLDGFTSNIGTPVAAGTSIDLSASQFQDVNSTIEFRIYGWGANAPQGDFSVNDFTFAGSVTPVPETTSVLAISAIVIVALSILSQHIKLTQFM